MARTVDKLIQLLEDKYPTTLFSREDVEGEYIIEVSGTPEEQNEAERIIADWALTEEFTVSETIVNLPAYTIFRLSR